MKKNGDENVFKKLQRFGLLFAFGLAAVALLGACSSDEDSGGEAPGTLTEANETTVAVTLSEWAVEPDASSVPAGEVKFSVSNEGTIPHELVIIRSEADPEALPVEGGIVPEDEVDVVGEVEEFPAGETDSGSFNLGAGNYLLICNIPAHYEQGMRVALTIE